VKSKRDTAVDGAANVGAALFGAAQAAPQAAQVDRIVSGLGDMARAAEHLQEKLPEILKGDLFEYIEVAKFNAEAAASDPSLVAKLTRELGRPHAAADILIERADGVSREVQAKASGNAATLTRSLRDPAYEGMQKLVPSDKATEVKNLAEVRSRSWARHGYDDFARQDADTARNVTGDLHEGGVTSGGTTGEELDFASKHSNLYRLRVEARYVAGEAAVAGGRAAVAGVVVGGAISVIKNGVAVVRGKKELGDAALAVGKDAAQAGVKSGATGALGAVLRYGGARAGVQSLAKSNVATAVAAGVIDVGVAVYRYVRGEVTGEQAAEQIGQTGCSTMSSIYAGAAAGLVFGPAGAVVGAMGGYLVATQVYQSTLAILRRARLAEAEAARAEALCADAIQAMTALRLEIEVRVAEIVGRREARLAEALVLIDRGLDSASPDVAIGGLTMLAESCGRSLKLATFEEFDDFMLNSTEPLRF